MQQGSKAAGYGSFVGIVTFQVLQSMAQSMAQSNGFVSAGQSVLFPCPHVDVDDSCDNLDHTCDVDKDNTMAKMAKMAKTERCEMAYKCMHVPSSHGSYYSTPITISIDQRIISLTNLF
jgi:hypothetical protein